MRERSSPKSRRRLFHKLLNSIGILRHLPKNSLDKSRIFVMVTLWPIPLGAHMKYSLKGSKDEKVGYHRGIFTKSYQEARAIYDAKIRNWEIELSGPLFFVTGSDDETYAVYFDWIVKNCECEHFIVNQSGTCMHIEAIKLLVHKEMIDLRSLLQKSITYVDSRYQIVTKGNGDFTTPSVRPWRSFSENNVLESYEPPTDNFDVFTDYDIKLRSFQLSSVETMLRNKRTVLCLQMGLGKTLAALACIYIIEPKRILIVAPNSLKYQWQREINRFKPG